MKTSCLISARTLGLAPTPIVESLQLVRDHRFDHPLASDSSITWGTGGHLNFVWDNNKRQHQKQPHPRTVGFPTGRGDKLTESMLTLPRNDPSPRICPCPLFPFLLPLRQASYGVNIDVKPASVNTNAQWRDSQWIRRWSASCS